MDGGRGDKRVRGGKHPPAPPDLVPQLAGIERSLPRGVEEVVTEENGAGRLPLASSRPLTTSATTGAEMARTCPSPSKRFR